MKLHHLLFILCTLCAVHVRCVPPETSSNGLDSCSLCKTAVVLMGKFVNETGVSEQDFERAVDFLCNKTALFTSAINEWGKSNVYSWIKFGNSDILCSKLEFCRAAVLAANFWSSQRECQFCEQVVGAVEYWMVKYNDTINTVIEKNLELVCDYVPAFYRVCELVIDYGVPRITAWIEKEAADPKATCTEIHACSAVEQPLVSNDSTECLACTVIVGAVEHWLYADIPREEIKAKFQQLCALVPAFEQQCDEILEQGFDEFLDWVQKEENPRKVCDQLNFCDAQVPVIINAV